MHCFPPNNLVKWEREIILTDGTKPIGNIVHHTKAHISTKNLDSVFIK
jgi:hypothetical protein